MIEIPVQAATLTSVNAFGSKRSETKTTKRVSKALLKSSNKKRAVFQKLTVVLFPNQTAFKKINPKKPSVLSEDVKKVQKTFIAVTQYLPKAQVLEIDISSRALIERKLVMLMVKPDLYNRDTYATQ